MAKGKTRKKWGAELELEGYTHLGGYKKVCMYVCVCLRARAHKCMYYLCPPRLNDIPMATSTSSVQILVPKYHIPLLKTWTLWINGWFQRRGKETQDELGTSYAQNKEMLNEWRGILREKKKDTGAMKGSPINKSGTIWASKWQLIDCNSLNEIQIH